MDAIGNTSSRSGVYTLVYQRSGALVTFPTDNFTVWADACGFRSAEPGTDVEILISGCPVVRAGRPTGSFRPMLPCSPGRFTVDRSGKRQ